MKIYVASSWRNGYQEGVVKRLREEGHEVYDFKNPAPGNPGFHWGQIDPDYRRGWSEPGGAVKYLKALATDIANDGFKLDFDAMKWADACVLVLPCGRSAHLEAGWFVGQGKPCLIYIPQYDEPELMYKMADIHLYLDTLVVELRSLEGAVI